MFNSQVNYKRLLKAFLGSLWTGVIALAIQSPLVDSTTCSSQLKIEFYYGDTFKNDVAESLTPSSHDDTQKKL